MSAVPDEAPTIFAMTEPTGTLHVPAPCACVSCVVVARQSATPPVALVNSWNGRAPAPVAGSAASVPVNVPTPASSIVPVQVPGAGPGTTLALPPSAGAAGADRKGTRPNSSHGYI